MNTSEILQSPSGSQAVESEWDELSDRVRVRLRESESALRHRPEFHEFQLLAADVKDLCDRFDRLHREVHRLLSDYHGAEKPSEETIPPVDAAAVGQASVEIQREQHSQSSGPMEVLKALFLWRDNPEDRAREEQLDDDPRSKG